MIKRQSLFRSMGLPSKLSFVVIVATILTGTNYVSAAEDPTEVPVEIGTANWLRSLSVAKQKSAEAEKPLLVFFQEVPG